MKPRGRPFLRRKISLSDEGGGGGGLVLESRGHSAHALVVASEAVDSRLDEDETELGVLVLAVLLEVLAHTDGLLDKAVQILRDGGGEA